MWRRRPIWAYFMDKATAGKPVENFEMPAGIMSVRVDPKTGQPAGLFSEGTNEIFLDKGQGSSSRDSTRTLGAASKTNPRLFKNAHPRQARTGLLRCASNNIVNVFPYTPHDMVFARLTFEHF